jgi:hypothetical protein
MQDNFSRGNPVVRENAGIMNANLAGGPALTSPNFTYALSTDAS